MFVCLWGGGGSDNGSLGGGQVDGVNASGKGFLQVLQDVTARAVGRGVVQQLLEWLHLYQHYHVLQKVSLYVGGQVWGTEELEEMNKTSGSDTHRHTLL